MHFFIYLRNNITSTTSAFLPFFCLILFVYNCVCISVCFFQEIKKKQRQSDQHFDQYRDIYLNYKLWCGVSGPGSVGTADFNTKSYSTVVGKKRELNVLCVSLILSTKLSVQYSPKASAFVSAMSVLCVVLLFFQYNQNGRETASGQRSVSFKCDL